MRILAIESSCDETSAAVVEMDNNNRKILSNIIATQIETHKLYGGVVPEIASRAHTEAVSSITYEALEKASLALSDIEAIAVTNRPGLIGALLVGVNFAKSLAYANKIPLIPVNHIHGHIAANYFSYPELKPPFTAIVASGGHTSIIEVQSFTEFCEIGSTRDDAIGEAFDKVARVMGLPYPGGSEMDRLAAIGDPKAIKFPSAAIADKTYDFSFSGLKTSVINYLHHCNQTNEEYRIEDVAASFTETVVSSVIKKIDMVYTDKKFDKLVLAGGVAANSHLRCALEEYCKQKNTGFFMPPLSLCGDNAAMIGGQAFYDYIEGNIAGNDLNGYAN